MNLTRTRLLLAPLALAAVTLSLAACGSDDDSSSSDTASVTQPSTDDMATDGTDMAGDMAGDMGGEAVTVGAITVADAWVREPAAGQTTSAAYATITNDGDTEVTLVSASVPFDATVEIHETIMGEDGAMQMQERPDGFEIAAGQTFTLEPGGPHVMLLDIDPADITGTVEVTLVFDDGTEVTVPAEVRTLDDMGDMGDMGDMDDDMTGTTMSGG